MTQESPGSYGYKPNKQFGELDLIVLLSFNLKVLIIIYNSRINYKLKTTLQMFK